MENFLGVVDEAGIQCVLTATGEGLDLYKRLRFEEVGVIELKLWEYEGGKGMGLVTGTVMKRLASG